MKRFDCKTREEANEAAFHFQMFDAHCPTCRTEITIQNVVLVFNQDWETIAVFKWSDHIPTLSELIMNENK